MGSKQRVYRQRIRSTQSLKKIFRAMELIAASRIAKARERVGAASPYAKAITHAIEAVAEHAQIGHPLTTERTDTNRVALLVVTADRGMAGAYTATALRESERLREQLVEQGKEVVQFVAGRRGVSYFAFRRRPLAGQWTGGSDSPPLEVVQALWSAAQGVFVHDEACAYLQGRGIDLERMSGAGLCRYLPRGAALPKELYGEFRETIPRINVRSSLFSILSPISS